MPLRDDILNPVSEENPGGENLRYAPVYDKIKEARRQDDDAAQGDWQRERKVADYALVVKLASETIATKSKDLQLGAWLTEALLATQGYAGLADGLGLLRGIVENFWESCWPELDDGDSEFRAAPIEWVGQYLAIPAKRVSITRGGHDYLKYLEAKSVGYEPAYEDSDTRKEAYATAVSEGKLALEEFDKAVAATSREFYEALVGNLDTCLTTIEESQPVYEDKFGEYSPSFNKLRESLEEVRRVTKGFLSKKEAPPPEVEEPEPEQEQEAPPEYDETPQYQDEEPEAPKPQKRPARRVTSVEPADKDDAAVRVAAAAAYWRREDPYSPAPYMMLRGMRWGELRASSSLDTSLFEPPTTEVRTSLKRLLNEGSYGEAIEIAENAMAESCGRAWLDLQRYVVTACDNMGYSAVSDAIKAELKSLVRDYPDLLTYTLLDDTPTANAETVRWINEFAQAEEPAVSTQTWSEPPPAIQEQETSVASEDSGPDTYSLAMDAVRAGNVEHAIELLSDEAARQTSGRARFQRKLQLAQICLGAGHEPIALSVLEELAEAIDRHQLEEWESADLVAHALSLLYSCQGASDRGRIYARICRLSPVLALKHGSQVAHAAL